MAEVFAPFVINRTIRNLTFYVMEGRNFVRKKSSLSRRKVLYSPRFERTRKNAALMGQASKIGSFVYNSLPAYWRQSWMYRSFTGEAYKLLKKGKGELEIRQLLLDRYVKEVVDKQGGEQLMSPKPAITKRTYTKQDSIYWENKTPKNIRRKLRLQQRQRNSSLLAEASRIASELYNELPVKSRNRSSFKELTGLAMRWLKEQEEDWQSENTPTTSKIKRKTNALGYVNYQHGFFVFKSPVSKRYLKKRDAPYSGFRKLVISHPV